MRTQKKETAPRLAGPIKKLFAGYIDSSLVSMPRPVFFQPNRKVSRLPGMGRGETARERRRQIKKLLDFSTLEERRRIKEAQRAGSHLREELEAFEQGEL